MNNFEDCRGSKKAGAEKGRIIYEHKTFRLEMRLVRSGRFSAVGRVARRPSVRKRTRTEAWATRRSARNRSVTLDWSGGIGFSVVRVTQPARHSVRTDGRQRRAHGMVVRGSQPAHGMVVCVSQPARHSVRTDGRQRRAHGMVVRGSQPAHGMVVRGSQPAEERICGPPLPEAAARAAPQGAASYFGRHDTTCR